MSKLRAAQMCIKTWDTPMPQNPQSKRSKMSPESVLIVTDIAGRPTVRFRFEERIAEERPV